MKIGKSLKGSGMVEVITGIFLISLAFSLTVVVFTKTMDNAKLYLKHRAINEINQLAVKQMKELDYSPVEADSGDVKIISSVENFPENDSLKIIRWSAVMKLTGKEIYSRKIIKQLRIKY
jgi:hypothetical protein